MTARMWLVRYRRGSLAGRSLTAARGSPLQECSFDRNGGRSYDRCRGDGSQSLSADYWTVLVRCPLGRGTEGFRP